MRHVLGSSLIESLVALAVFAIGGASTATWIMQSMATNARASRLVAATTIVVSLEARMRANREGVLAGDYASAGATVRKKTAGEPIVRDCAKHYGTDGCDPREVAAEDLGVFRAELLRWLGSAAVGSVTCKLSAECVIAVTWSGREVLNWPFRA